MFAGFAGVVLIDGASDFNLLERGEEGVVRAGCWAHARRMLYQAMSYDKALALAGLAAIRQLFVAERAVMGAPIAARVAMRSEPCAPVLAGLRKWVDLQLPKQVPGTPMHKALQYLDNQWSRLTVFLRTAVLGRPPR